MSRRRPPLQLFARSPKHPLPPTRATDPSVTPAPTESCDRKGLGYRQHGNGCDWPISLSSTNHSPQKSEPKTEKRGPSLPPNGHCAVLGGDVSKLGESVLETGRGPAEQTTARGVELCRTRSKRSSTKGNEVPTGKGRGGIAVHPLWSFSTSMARTAAEDAVTVAVVSQGEL